MNRLRQAYEILRHMGPRWAAYRTRYAVRKKLGLIDRPGADAPSVPQGPVAFDEVAARSNFLVRPGQLPDRAVLLRFIGEEAAGRILQTADNFCEGRFLYYSRKTVDHGRPVDWLRVPTKGGSHHARVLWTEYPTFSRELGDVKTVWEPSRFACAFWLARAYALTGGEKYPLAFWELLESWIEQNPHKMGPNWKCGQEAAFRAFALTFAVYAMRGAKATTDERLARYVALMQKTLARILKNIDYAVSQKNNHGISEAVGVFTIATLLSMPIEAEIGRRILEEEVARQVYDDGAFVQHSMNYHRVMLHDALWAMRLAELNGRPLTDAFRARVGKAAEFLFEMLDPETGRVPNYGANDGALVLPLDACDYTDYRPVVQAAMYAATGRRVLPHGPHDEAGLWLYGEAFLQSPVEPREPRSRRFDAGGYYTIRGDKTWCMVRCHTYHDRPAHVDMLHLDLFANGVNLLSDSGTYLYYSPDEPHFERFFKDISAHNTIEVGGRGPLELASRFLWVPWPKGIRLEHSAARFVGEHDAYARAPWRTVHRRSIDLNREREWLITDELLGDGEHDVSLRWHLADGPFVLHTEQRWIEIEPCCFKARLKFDMPDAMRINVRRGDDAPDRVMGWQSLYYGERTPRPTVELTGRAKLPMKITTRISIEGHSAS